jgi:hypothetical protein
MASAAGLAFGLALAGLAQPASAASLITLNSASMDGTYTANINYDDNVRGIHEHETAYSNGVTFNVTDIAAPNATYDLYGFCIDVFHNMYLGGLGYTYESTYGDTADPLSGDYGTPALALTSDQKNWITTLVDLGFLIHGADPTGAKASLQTAAIQAAIWDTIHPGSITLNNGGANVGGSRTFQQYFDEYRTLHGAGDRIFTITDVVKDGGGNGAHQTFAVGWPVPEPSSWALMILGLGAVGAMLRRRAAFAA